MFAALEKPAAYAAFFFAFLTVIWKSPIGVEWIPVIGSAWKDMFRSHSDERIPQYPRRSEDEDFWHVVYFLMYGVLGTVAQYGGIKITNRTTANRESLVSFARIYGAFHLVIGTHHLIWSLKKTHGKLELWRFDIPGIYAGTCLSALILMYHALCIVRVTVQSANLKDLCYRKAVMDTATCSTFISAVVFLVCNMVGIETSFETERLWWAITMYFLPVILLVGFLLQD